MIREVTRTEVQSPLPRGYPCKVYVCSRWNRRYGNGVSIVKPYRSAGEKYLAMAIPGPFNLTVSFLELEDFECFRHVHQTNESCYRHWPWLMSQIFSVFLSKEALRWVIFTKGINARGWELHLKVLDYRISHNASFAKVCREGDLDIVQAMVERTQVDLERKDAMGWSPLLNASTFDRLSVVQYLCEQGTNKETKGRDGRRPLHMAAQEGHLSVVQYLCEQGADKEARDIYRRRPLHRAASNGHLLVVQYLSQQGADKEARAKDGRRPLHYAAGGGHLPVVHYLCEQGAEGETRDKYGRTPAFLARKHSSVLAYLRVVEQPWWTYR